MTTELVPTQPSVEPDPVPTDATDAVEVDPTAAMAEVILQTRRAVVPAIVLGVVGLVVGVVLGELLAAVGFCIGLGLGMLNARMLRQSVQRRFEILVDTPGAKTHFLSGGAARLGPPHPGHARGGDPGPAAGLRDDPRHGRVPDHAAGLLGRVDAEVGARMIFDDTHIEVGHHTTWVVGGLTFNVGHDRRDR